MNRVRGIHKWVLAVAAGLAAFCGLEGIAQTPGNTPLPGQRPLPPAGTIAPPGFSIEVRPGGPIITDPQGMNPGGANAPAASASFVPDIARVGRPVEYTIRIVGGQRVLELPNLPQVEGLEIVPAGRSYSMPLQSIGSTFSFAVTPLRAGDFVIPGFSVNVGGQQVRVPDASLKVMQLQPGEDVYQPTRVVIDVPKREYFVGEVIEGRLLFFETQDELPQYVQHVAKSSGGVLFKPSMRTRREQLVWEGRPVNALVMPVEITPLVAGDTEVNCQVIVHVNRVGASPFQRGLTQSTIDVPSVRFKVLPLPQIGRPPGFTGAIGQFTIGHPKLSASEIEVGEPLSLEVALTGTGNLEGVPAPELEPSPEWMAYRPTSDLQRNDEAGPGTKVFTFTLVPRREGRRSTPALPFAYFDPARRTFVDVTVPPLPVLVKPSASGVVAPMASGAPESIGPTEPPREAEPVLTGLAETSGAWRDSLAPGLRSFFWFQLLPPAILVALWFGRKRAEYLAAHPEILRRRRALRAARRALAGARAAVRRGDHAEFLQASLGALREAASPLGTAESSSLTREEVLRELRADERAARAARSLFESAEAARYSSVEANGVEPRQLLPEVEHAVAHLSSRR